MAFLARIILNPLYRLFTRSSFELDHIEAFDRAEVQTNNPVVLLMPQQTSSSEGVAQTSTPSELAAGSVAISSKGVAVTPEGVALTSTRLKLTITRSFIRKT
jgi:hypothetical protein